MKRNIALYCLLLTCFGFAKPSTPLPDSWIDKWKVDDTVAQRMINYLDSCDADCHDESTTTTLAEDNLDRRIARELEREGYGNLSITFVKARYTDGQAKKYKKNRNLDDAKGNVKGYKTMLLVVIPGSGDTGGVSFASFHMASAMYFDVYTICPPPTDCRTSRSQ